MSWLIALILLYISFVDLKFHRIPNVALLLLAPLAALHAIASKTHWSAQFMPTVILFLLLLILWYFFDLGMGDVKLLTLLSLSIIPGEKEAYLIFLSIFSVATLIHLAALKFTSPTWNSRIPLAPSISIATILMLSVK